MATYWKHWQQYNVHNLTHLGENLQKLSRILFTRRSLTSNPNSAGLKRGWWEPIIHSLANWSAPQASQAHLPPTPTPNSSVLNRLCKLNSTFALISCRINLIPWLCSKDQAAWLFSCIPKRTNDQCAVSFANLPLWNVQLSGCWEDSSRCPTWPRECNDCHRHFVVWA